MFLLYIIILCNIAIGPTSVPDIAMVVLFVIAFKEKISFSKNKIILLALPLIAIVPMLINLNDAYFDEINYFLSLTKFIFYLLAFICIPTYIIKREKSLNKILYNILKIILVYAFFQLIVFYFFPSGIKEMFIKDTSTSYGFFRITSVFKEPAHMFYMVILYFFLVKNKIKISKFVHVMVIVFSILTFSFVVYGVYLGCIFILNFRGTFKKKLTTVFSILFAFTGLYLFVPIIQRHVHNLITMSSSSASSRIFGGFEYMIKAPITGVGMGQISNYYNYYKEVLNFQLVTLNGTVHNIFAVLYLYFGIIGLLIFLIYLFKEYYNRYSKQMLFIFLLSFFAWGAFNGAYFFMMLIILDAYHRIAIKKEKQINQ